jgi:hypothetical protein
MVMILCVFVVPLSYLSDDRSALFVLRRVARRLTVELIGRAQMLAKS